MAVAPTGCASGEADGRAAARQLGLGSRPKMALLGDAEASGASGRSTLSWLCSAQDVGRRTGQPCIAVQSGR